MYKLSRKAFFIAFGDAASRGFSFITSIYLARTLGTEYYGLIVIAVSVLGYCFWFADLGLVNVAIRETAKEPEHRRFRPREILYAKTLLGAVVLLLSFLTISALNFSGFNRGIILKYLYSLIPYMLMMEWYLSGRQFFDKIAAAKTLNGVVYAALVFILIKKPADIELVPWLYISGSAAAALVLGISAFSDGAFRLPSRGLNTYRELFKAGSVVGAGWFFTQIGQLLPPILIGIFLSVSEAGIYGAAYRVIILVMILDRVFSTLLLPNLSALWSENPEMVKKRTGIILHTVIAGGFLLTMLTAVNAGDVIQLLYGEEYAGGAVILYYLSFFIVFTFMNSLFSFGLLAIGKDRDYLFATITGGVISAVLIVFFSIFGTAKSVAAAVALSELAMMAAACFWFNKYIPVRFMRGFIYIGIPAVLSIFAASLLPEFTLLISAAGTGAVLLVAYYTGALNPGELRWLLNKLK